MTPLAFLRDATRPQGRAIAIGIAAAAVIAGATSLLPAAAGLLLASKGATWAIGTAVVGAALLAVRGAIRQQLAHQGRTTTLAHIGRVFATRSALSTASHAADRIEAKLFGAAYASSRLLSEQAPAIIGNTIALLLVLPIIVWLTSWKLVAIGVPAAGALGAALLMFRRYLTRKMTGAHEAAMALVDETSSLMRGHLELAAASRLDRQAENVASRGSHYSEALRMSERASAIGGRVPLLAAGSIALLGGWLWLGSDPGLLESGLVKLLVIGSVIPMVGGLARSISETQRGLREVGQLVELIDLPDAPASKAHATRLDPEAAIRVHNVSYRYADDALPALEGFSMTWRSGELLALTGPNGTGKSTLARLLLRLADPESGAIYVGSTDLREGDLEVWRRSIAYLPQRPHLPEGFTLRAVVSTFGPDVDEQALLDALDKVGLRSKLERYHPSDPLQARVAMLSAGERQRFALARVLADVSPVLILDEPDANLDAKGLGILISMLPDLSIKRRILVVAHDRRLLACAHRVVELGSTSGAPGASAASN